MSTIWKLFRLQIDEKIDIFKKGKPWKIILTIFLYLAIIAVATVALFFAFLKFVSIGLYPDNDLLAILLLFTQVLSFAIAFGSIIKNLYHSKDNDLLMSLPCDHKQIFISKLLVLYAYELIANTLYTMPILVMFGLISSVSIGYWFMSLLFVFLLPLLSLVLAAFFSIPVIFIVNKIKRYPIVASLSLVIVVAGFLGLYMWLIISFTNSIDFVGQQDTILTQVNNVIAKISSNTIIFKLMADGLLFNSGWWWKDLILVGTTIIFLVFTMILVQKVYFTLAMKNSETSTYIKSRQKKDIVESPFKSIIRKELYTIFREPGNVFQYFIFTILMPFIVLMYDKMLLSINVNQTGQAMIVASHVLVVAILAMLSNIVSASAVSREGGNFYITKMSPSQPRLQINAKIVFNLIFTYSALIITSIFTGIFTDISLWHNILCTVAVAIMSLGHIVTSILLDLRKPALDWFDSNEIEKISKNTRNSMLLGLLFAVIMFAIVMAFAPTSHTIWPWSILLSTVSIYTISILLYYHFNINKIYEKVEC